MTEQKKNKGLNIFIWVVQGLFAIMFIMAGLMKLSQPMESLAESLPWVTSTSSSLVRFIGLSELLGGLGLILPSITRIKPNLTIYAAYGIMTIMIMAAIFHGTRGEYGAIAVNIFIAGLIYIVVWGRGKKLPIQEK